MSIARFPREHCIWDTPAIWHPDAPREGYVVLQFRRTFDLSTPLDGGALWVSADERFALFLDGKVIARGPSRSTPMRWTCSRVPVGLLARGRHVLAATVWCFGSHAPLAQYGRGGFFLLSAEGRGGKPHAVLAPLVNTGPSWRCVRDQSRTPLPSHAWGPATTFDVIGSGERIDASAVPWGFERADYDDSAWQAAVQLCTARPVPYGMTPLAHWLAPDPLPQMDEEPQQFARLIHGPQGPRGADGIGLPLTVPPGTTVRMVFDRGELTNAYPLLSVSGGAGGLVRMVTVEAAMESMPWRKGNRDQIDGKHLWGHLDEFLPDGPRRTFTTLWWRPFRYAELTLTAGRQPLTVEEFRLIFSGFPLRQRASFAADAAYGPTVEGMWAIGWRTARLCAHETYFDCPHYEQLQYVGDTRIQALFSYLVGDEDRLARKAIDDFHLARTDGLVHSRSPCRLGHVVPLSSGLEGQIIPGFSLYWIGMLDDLRMYRGDVEFLRQYVSAAREIVEWFERRLSRRGVLGWIDHWPFYDWVKGWKAGNAPQDEDGGSTIYAMLLATACRWLTRLETACGYPDLARRWTALGKRIVAGTLEAAWDARRGLLADTPRKKSFSVHAQVQAVLAGAWPARRGGLALARAMSDPTVTQPGSLYYRYYVIQALKAAGCAGKFFDLLPRWEAFIKLGLTTWPENDEPTRSDCHAWSVTPSIEFLQTVLGVQPDPSAEGFGRIIFAPTLGPLARAQGVVPTPRGLVRVKLARTGKVHARTGLAVVRAELRTPVPALVAPRARPLPAGRHTIEL